LKAFQLRFIKGAFLDRIHLYNPGWEIKMLKKDSFSKGYGLITDYIAAVLHELRNNDRDKYPEGIC
jgi:ATP-dependent Lon protease